MKVLSIINYYLYIVARYGKNKSIAGFFHDSFQLPLAQRFMRESYLEHPQL